MNITKENNHKIAVQRYFQSLSIKGLRMCTVCKKRKQENEFSHQVSLFKNTGTCKECKSLRDKEYKIKKSEYLRRKYIENMKNPDFHKRIREINRLAVSKRRIGKDRDKIISLETQCYICGITQKEHLEKMLKKNGKGISLSVHHINNKGRAFMNMGYKPDNSQDNLMILCSACHCRQHNFERSYVGRGKKTWKTRRARYGKLGHKKR